MNETLVPGLLQFLGRLARASNWRLPNRADTADAIQDACLSLLTIAELPTEECRLHRLAARILRRRIVDRWRQYGRETSLLSDYEHVCRTRNIGTSEHRNIGTSEHRNIGTSNIEYRRSLLRACLSDPASGLSEAETSVLKAALDGALTWNEVARITGLPRSTLWSARQRVERKLALRFGDLVGKEFRVERRPPSDIAVVAGIDRVRA